MRKRPAAGETTRIVWDSVFEELKCEKCQAILYWNFGFKTCPYCNRRIAEVEARGVRTDGRAGSGMIIR